MRFIDFMMFYTMANFKRQKGNESIEGKLIRAIFFPALVVSVIVSIAVEIFYFLFFHINIVDGSNFFIKWAIGAILCGILIDYVYRQKRRYEYIISPQYKVFPLRIPLGIIIVFLIFIIS